MADLTTAQAALARAQTELTHNQTDFTRNQTDLAQAQADMIRSQRHMNEVVAAMLETHKHTEEKLEVFIGVLERYISSRQNGEAKEGDAH
jgi:phage-related minor tail protein